MADPDQGSPSSEGHGRVRPQTQETPWPIWHRRWTEGREGVGA